MKMWRNIGSNIVGHKIRREQMELMIQFNRHFEVLSIEYPTLTKQALMKGLDIYEPLLRAKQGRSSS